MIITAIDRVGTYLTLLTKVNKTSISNRNYYLEIDSSSVSQPTPTALTIRPSRTVDVSLAEAVLSHPYPRGLPLPRELTFAWPKPSCLCPLEHQPFG